MSSKDIQPTGLPCFSLKYCLKLVSCNSPRSCRPLSESKALGNETLDASHWFCKTSKTSNVILGSVTGKVQIKIGGSFKLKCIQNPRSS